MASGSEKYGNRGTRLKKSTAASKRIPTYQPWHPGMNTPF